MKKEDGRKIPRDAMEHFRFQAIKLWKKKKKVKEIAEFFGVTIDAVYKWIRKYKQKGLNGLKKKMAHGAKPKLEKKDIRKIISCIKKPATDFGYETALWDCRRLQQLIKKQLKKDIHISNIWRMLKSWKISRQVPEKKALEQDEKAVKKWLEEEWPKIKKHARRWQAIIYFQDECGVSLIPVAGKTWAPKGETPYIKVTGKKGGLCVTSAISPVGRMLFRIEKEKIKAPQHVEFLQQILRHHPNRKIIVVEDRAPVHRAGEVKDFVEQNKKRFALYYIPSYSPELNPDEKTWRYLKKNKLKAHLAQSTAELKKVVSSKMKGIQRRPLIIKSFFYDSILY